MVATPFYMRILGIDYGMKRIGVAVSDELGLTAQPLATIERRNRERDLRTIGDYVRDFGVDTVVVGYPVMLDGSEGVQCKKVRRFVKYLSNVVSVPIVMWDESFSTSEAEEILLEADIRRRKRKGIIDKIAASIILQGYLDRKRSGTEE